MLKKFVDLHITWYKKNNVSIVLRERKDQLEQRNEKNRQFLDCMLKIKVMERKGSVGIRNESTST